MAKTFLVMAALGAPGQAEAQDVSAGLILGLTSSTLASDSADAAGRTGWSAGAFLEVAPTDSHAVLLEVLYATNGTTLPAATLALDYLRVQALMKLNWGDGGASWTVSAGPTFGRNLRGEVRGAAGTSDLDSVRPWEVGWVAGTGVEFDVGKQTLRLDGRYSRGITGAFEGAGDKNQALSLAVGWYVF